LEGRDNFNAAFMKNFDLKSFEHLKKLCRIECSEEEDQELLRDLKKVLQYVELLDELNTENVPTCRYVLRGMLQNKMREDQVGELLSRDKFLTNAPDQIGGMIKTPPVLKQSS
jgi:aspartyl-tRNA(Asn)/glutamyl-tRNA(Gln) amidotransferase subunit C